MYRLLFILSLGCGTLGCQSFGHPKACAPGEPCYQGNAAPVTTVTAPAPKIEVQTPETIIVRAPAQKVIIEQPAAPTYPGPGYGGAPPNNNYGAGPPNMPPGGVMPVAYNPGMQMNGYGAAPSFGGNAIMGSEINERTSIGFMFDTIKIPIPWIRLKAIPRPTEVTFRTQLANPGVGSPVVVAASGFGGVPMGGYGGPPPSYGGGQMVYTGTQYVPVQGTIPVQVPTGGSPPPAPGGSGTGFGTAFGTGFGATPAPAENTAETVEKLRQKIRECEELQKQLKSLQPPAK